MNMLFYQRHTFDFQLKSAQWKEMKTQLSIVTSTLTWLCRCHSSGDGGTTPSLVSRCNSHRVCWEGFKSVDGDCSSRRVQCAQTSTNLLTLLNVYKVIGHQVVSGRTRTLIVGKRSIPWYCQLIMACWRHGYACYRIGNFKNKQIQETKAKITPTTIICYDVNLLCFETLLLTWVEAVWNYSHILRLIACCKL